MTRRDYGSVRRRRSGRWQARFATPAGERTTAPETFPTRASAAAYLAKTQTDIDRGSWLDPVAAAQTSASTRPRGWRTGPTSGVGRSTVAKAYRLLKTILNTAVADEVIARNPCALRGASAERTPERVPPTLVEAHALAEAIEPRWRMLVLLATWSGLRWGELVALRRGSLDLNHGRLTVADQLVETQHERHLGPPKTDAGRRTVYLPPHLIPELTEHLDRWIAPGPVRGCSAGRWAPRWPSGTSPATGPAHGPRQGCHTSGSTTSGTCPPPSQTLRAPPRGSSWHG